MTGTGEAGTTDNEVIRQLFDRRSVRAFEERDIPEPVREAILAAACQAPTPGDQQLYSIIDVRDQGLKEALARSCDNQPFIARAPMVLVFCADCRKWPQVYRLAGVEPRPSGVGDLMLAVSDANIAAQNAVVAAWALGVGSCHIGDIMEGCDVQRELLGLPELVFPAAMLVLGYPTAQQANRPKPPRAPLDAIVMRDRYREADPDALHDLVRARQEGSGRTFEEWVGAFCARKYDSGFSREMTRSVAEYLEQYATSFAGVGDEPER